MTFSRKMVAIEPIIFNKVEAKVEGGFARIAQKIEVVKSRLVMAFYDKETTHVWATNDYAILSGDSGLQAWNKQVLEYNGKKFVLCPVDAIIAFEGTNEV
jgi:hypothetical protein